MSNFSFSLTHTLTVFLSISSHGLHLSKWLNISFCFALSGTHTHWPNVPFFFLFFFSVSACLTRLSHCPRNGRLTLEALHYFIIPSYIAFFIDPLRPSEQSRKIQGDSGSLCPIPLEGLMLPLGSPFTTIEYEKELMHSIIDQTNPPCMETHFNCQLFKKNSLNPIIDFTYI